VSSPTSFTNIVPLPGSSTILNGLRRPAAQIARRFPDREPKNGFVPGMVPVSLIRRTLPTRFDKSWLAPPTPSPVVT
jgi:hypothetical protein